MYGLDEANISAFEHNPLSYRAALLSLEMKKEELCTFGCCGINDLVTDFEQYRKGCLEGKKRHVDRDRVLVFGAETWHLKDCQPRFLRPASTLRTFISRKFFRDVRAI